MVFQGDSLGALAAIADCSRPIQAVWSGYDGNRIYVLYRDGFAPAGMMLTYVNNDEHVANRTLSVILAGQLGGKSVIFRYLEGEDGSPPSCTPAVTQKRIGAWVMN